MALKITQLFRFNSVLFASVLLILSQNFVFAGNVPPGDNDKSIQDIISSMSLEQKAQLVIGTGMFFPVPDSLKDLVPMMNPPIVGNSDYAQMVRRIRQYVPGAAGRTAAFNKLGITTQVLCDGPAGLRILPHREGDQNTYYCTAFPIATLLASTWDTTMVYSVGKAMGNEVHEYGADIILGPGMNLQRDPLCGRNFEYYSEDPLITGKIAAAMVNGIQSNGVGTSIKHFVANNQETNRLSVNETISQRALRELYLRGFEIAVKEAHPWTVMSSYNKVNGTYTSQSYDLLTKILRDDWGFKGYVMSDWTAGDNVVAQLKAGNDEVMPGEADQIKTIIDAVNNGQLDEKVLDTSIARILGIMMKSPHYKDYKFSNKPDMKAHAEVTRQAASNGMVLLKNSNDALPISTTAKKVAAFGNSSYELISGGTGSGDVNEAYTVSLIDGLKNAGYQPDAELTGIYESYIKEMRAKGGQQNQNVLTIIMGGKEPVTEMNLSAELAEKMAEKTDIALITIGRNSGEGSDRKAVPGDFYLSSVEKDMINKVTKAYHAKGKKVIVVLNIGGVIGTASWRDIPDAILLAWQPGQEGGNSIVDVLSGKVDPSGRLAVSFPISYSDAPTAKDFPGHSPDTVKPSSENNTENMAGNMSVRVPWEVTYREGIYVGYRYYNTFNVPVAYEFGYGLSYTNFDFSNLKLDSREFNGKLNFSVDIKNSGSVAGREVVQAYVSAPDGKLKKPEEELKAFAKTRLLKPGESQTLHFTLSTKDLASFDEASSSWIAEPGKYTLKVGASSLKIKLTDTFELSKEMSAGKVSNALAPDKKIVPLSFK